MVYAHNDKIKDNNSFKLNDIFNQQYQSLPIGFCTSPILDEFF